MSLTGWMPPFLAGLFAGGLVGMFAMALAAASGRASREEEQARRCSCSSDLGDRGDDAGGAE